jgi:Uma2 family endonuclease
MGAAEKIDEKVLETPAKVTVAEFLPMIANEEPLELVEGQVVRKASPQQDHARTQIKLGEVLGPFNRRVGGPRGPGGWWIMSELDTLYTKTEEVFRHDAQGYLRALHPEPPKGHPCPFAPQWACEILSPSNPRIDWIKKQRTLLAHEVPHYWVIDPVAELLTVLRYQPGGYQVALTAGRGDVVRAEPFEAIEFALDELFGHA